MRVGRRCVRSRSRIRVTAQLADRQVIGAQLLAGTNPELTEFGDSNWKGTMHANTGKQSKR